jgi:acyl-CoA reductase-like NAD-dependent aldehyde dehydrogenase
MTPTHPDDLETILQRLSAKKAEWAAAPLTHRVELLKRVLEGALLVSERWAEAAAVAKGLDATSDPRAGEEWLSGPMPFVQNVRMMIDALSAGGERKPARVRTRPDGQKVVRVFPLDLKHRIVLGGTTADIWIEPGKPASQGSAIKNPPAGGALCVVLGAGNISAIPPMDALYKLFAEGQVVVLKMNPLNAAVGPLLETAFRRLVDEGIFAIVYGDAAMGAALVDHRLVDTLHVTGSDSTYEAIVFGAQVDERARRKASGERKNARPFTAELGCVTPVIVAPGPYSRRDLAYQARHVAAMLTHNGGFNCDAAQVLVVAKDWLQKRTFLEFLREELKSIPPRPTWAVGAGERRRAIAERYPTAEALSEPREGTLPWTLVPGLSASDATRDELIFRKEAFCGALAVVEIEDAAEPPKFLEKAVAFANERLWGTLSLTLLIHPWIEHDHEEAVEKAIAALRYGAIGVNAWPGLIFALAGATWGAFPGHPPTDIQSGTGVVHNALLLDFPEKTVVRAPFRSSPVPPYFPNLEGLGDLGRALTFFEAEPTWAAAFKVARAGLGLRRRREVKPKKVLEAAR